MRIFFNYLLLIVIALIWGSQFILIKTALTSFPPLTVATLRAVTGAVGLSLLLFLLPKKSTAEKKSRNLKNLIYIFCISLFEVTLPFILISWGQQHTTTSIAAILISTIPIFTIIFLTLFFKHEALNLGKYLSVIIGFLAVLILLIPNAIHSIAIGQNNFLAELAILAGAASFAISLLMIRRILDDNVIILVRNILWCGSIQLLPLAIIFNYPWTLQPSLTAILAVVILGVIASGFVYILYTILVKRAGAAFTSLNNYFIPLVGVALGIVIMHEYIAWNVYITFVVLMLAMLVNELKFSRIIGESK